MEKPTLDKIEALAGRGLTEQQIADALGIDIENCAVIKQRSGLPPGNSPESKGDC